MNMVQNLIKKNNVVIAIITFITLTSFTQIKTEQKIFVCMGKDAYTYHKYRDCSGLNNCASEIVSMSIDKAKRKYYRKPCKKCYNIKKSKTVKRNK